MYVGRLAPSPTGRVHMGIARTSLVAWLDARHHGGRLDMRIEDIDGPRTVLGAADEIMRDLEWLGLDWDGPPTFQSNNDERYRAAIETLGQLGRTFFCACSRKEIQAASAPHEKTPRYPGTCRDHYAPKDGRDPAIRMRTEVADDIEHEDRLLGRISQNVHNTIGDFVLRRSDGLWAYQLAVTVDDLEQGITCIVRGADLLDSMPRQLLLRRLLDPHAAPLDSLHVPLVVGDDGERLAKRHGARPIRDIAEDPKVLLGDLGWSLGILETNEPTTLSTLLDAYAPDRLRTEPWRAQRA